jgi:hypothetical protein
MISNVRYVYTGLCFFWWYAIIVALVPFFIKHKNKNKLRLSNPSPPCPDQLWGPPNLLFNGYQGFFPRE